MLQWFVRINMPTYRYVTWLIIIDIWEGAPKIELPIAFSWYLDPQAHYSGSHLRHMHHCTSVKLSKLATPNIHERCMAMGLILVHSVQKPLRGWLRARARFGATGASEDLEVTRQMSCLLVLNLGTRSAQELVLGVAWNPWDPMGKFQIFGSSATIFELFWLSHESY